MKTVEYSDEIRRDQEFFQLAERATRQLDEVVGQSANQLTARWDKVADDRGRQLLHVRINDQFDQAQLRFSPDQFNRPHLPDLLLGRLWGDLLEERSNRQVKALQDPPESE